MMSIRDELEALTSPQWRYTEGKDYSRGRNAVLDYLRALLAKYPAQVVKSVAELEALPVGTVVLEQGPGFPLAWQRWGDGWRSSAPEAPSPILPATVLYTNSPAQVAQPSVDDVVLWPIFERIWDSANCIGLDGWIGPDRGAGEVDEEALVQREKDIDTAVNAVLALFPSAPVQVAGEGEDVLRAALAEFDAEQALSEACEIPDDAPEVHGDGWDEWKRSPQGVAHSEREQTLRVKVYRAIEAREDAVERYYATRIAEGKGS